MRTVGKIRSSKFGYIYTLLMFIGVLERANVTILLTVNDGEMGTDVWAYCIGVNFTP